MRDLLDDGSRSVIFLFDVTACSVPKSIRYGRTVSDRRLVAREYTMRLIAAAERLLVHLDVNATSDVLWSYRLFNSRSVQLGTSAAKMGRPSLTTVSPASIEECRRAVLAAMQTSVHEQSVPTVSAEALSSAVNDAVSVVAPGGLGSGSPDSFLLESTDTDATPTRQAKEEQEKIDNAPLIVLFACAPQSEKELPIFLDEPGARCEKFYVGSEKGQALKVGHPAARTSTRSQRPFHKNLPLKHALENVLKSKTQLLWVQAYSRRSEESSCFSPTVVSNFKTWICRKPGVNGFIDLYSLLTDRNIAPFCVLARRASRPAQEKKNLMGAQLQDGECGRDWVPLDFYVTPDLSNEVNIKEDRLTTERVLKAEVSGLFPPEEAPSQHFAVCSSLLRIPSEGSLLSALRAFDSPGGLVRPTNQNSTSNSDNEMNGTPATSSQWISAFSGLMVSLSDKNTYLVAKIYASGHHAEAYEKPLHTILLQALSPLSAIVRVINPSRVEGLKMGLPGTSHPLVMSTVSSKRVFPDPCAQNSQFLDSVGDPRQSLNAAFFESHLIKATTVPFADNDISPHCVHASLRSETTSITPNTVSSALENLTEVEDGEPLQNVCLSLDAFDNDMEKEGCTEFLPEQFRCTQELMDKLRASLALKMSPSAQWSERGAVITNSPPALSAEAQTQSDAKRYPAEATETVSDHHETLQVQEDLNVGLTKELSVPCTPSMEDPSSTAFQAASLLLSIGRPTPASKLSDQNEIDAPVLLAESDFDKEDSVFQHFSGRFKSITEQIDDEVLLMSSIDKDDLILQCNTVLRSLRRIVELGIHTKFAYVKEKHFEKRVMKLGKIQKILSVSKESKNNSAGGEKLSHEVLSSCLRGYEQATLYALKASVAFGAHISEIGDEQDKFSEKTQRILDRLLKRASKVISMVQVFSVSHERHNNDGSPYSDLFDNFFVSVLSCFGGDGSDSGARSVAKALSEEYEKPLEKSESLQVPATGVSGRFLRDVSRSRHAESAQQLSPEAVTVSKRRRARETRSTSRKKPRTRDLKRVLAHAAATRIHQTGRHRESSRLTVEKGIQRPLQSRGRRASLKRRNSLCSSDPLYSKDVSTKQDAFARMLEPSEEECPEEEYVLPFQFYSKDQAETRPGSARDNPDEICVPETPENE